MRVLSFLILLLSVPTVAEAIAPELICDSDAKITFHSRWIRHSSVTISFDSEWELPWTGREEIISGHELREMQKKTNVDLASDIPLTEDLHDSTYFVTFRSKSGEQSLFENLLHIDRSLFLGRESDGLVIAQQLRILDPQEPRPSSKLTILHCRSR